MGNLGKDGMNLDFRGYNLITNQKDSAKHHHTIQSQLVTPLILVMTTLRMVTTMEADVNLLRKIINSLF